MRLYIEKLKEIEKVFGEFDIDLTWGTDPHMYFRFGYWQQISIGKLKQILGHNANVEEYSDFDDDCGWQYSYHIKD